MRGTIKSALFAAGLFAAVSCLDTPVASASYYANCQATIVIKKVHPLRGRSIDPKVKVTFSLVKIVSSGGHSRQACHKFLKKNLVQLFSVPKSLVGKVVAGSRHLARYSEWNGLTPKGVKSGGSWGLVPPPARKAMPRKATLEVRVGHRGGITVNGKRVAVNKLDKVFRAAFARNKNATVMIRAGRRVRHGTIVSIMERAKKAGLTRLAISTLP